MRAKLLVLAIPCLLPGLVACAGKQAPAIVGTLERHRIEVAAPFSEQILSVLVREGDRVAKDQLLAELDAASLDASHAASAAQLGELSARLAELRHGSREQEIAQSLAQVAVARADSDRADRDYQRQSDLAARGLVPVAQLDASRQARDAAAASLRAAQATLDLRRQGTRSEQIAQAEAAVRVGEQQLRQQTVLRQRLRLLAPVAGQIEALPYRLGERPPVGAPVVILLVSGPPFARVYVPEPELARVRAGMSVNVQIDGVSGPMHGTVRYVSGEANFTPYYALTQRDRGRLTYLAEIDIGDARAADLPVGLPLSVSLAGSH